MRLLELYEFIFYSSRRRQTRCALVTGVQRVLFRSVGGLRDKRIGRIGAVQIIDDDSCTLAQKRLHQMAAQASATACDQDDLIIDCKSGAAVVHGIPFSKSGKGMLARRDTASHRLTSLRQY